jgi:hypothetical protein
MKKTAVIVILVVAAGLLFSEEGFCRAAPIRMDALGNTVPTRTVSPKEPLSGGDQLGKGQKRSMEEGEMVDYKYDAIGNKVPVNTVEEGTFIPDKEKEMDNFEASSREKGQSKINVLGKEVPEKVR